MAVYEQRKEQAHVELMHPQTIDEISARMYDPTQGLLQNQYRIEKCDDQLDSTHMLVKYTLDEKEGNYNQTGVLCYGDYFKCNDALRAAIAASTPPMPSQDKPTFEIYQLKLSDETREIRFLSLDSLAEQGKSPDISTYDKMYEGDFTEFEQAGDTIGKQLEAGFNKFNLNRPDDFISNVVDGIIMPKKSKPEITIMSKDEQKKLANYINNNRNSSTLGVALSLYTGMRIGEICALRWENIDMEKRVLTVRHTIQRIQCFEGDRKTKVIIAEPKSQSSRREIPIPDCIMSMLKELKGKNSAFVLTGTEKTIEPRTMQYRFKRILENAGVGYYNFHVLRHSMASSAVELGFDVKTLSEILGHSSVQVTLDRYIHTSMEHKRNCMNLLTIAS